MGSEPLHSAAEAFTRRGERAWAASSLWLGGAIGPCRDTASRSSSRRFGGGIPAGHPAPFPAGVTGSSRRYHRHPPLSRTPAVARHARSA